MQNNTPHRITDKSPMTAPRREYDSNTTTPRKMNQINKNDFISFLRASNAEAVIAHKKYIGIDVPIDVVILKTPQTFQRKGQKAKHQTNKSGIFIVPFLSGTYLIFVVIHHHHLVLSDR